MKLIRPTKEEANARKTSRLVSPSNKSPVLFDLYKKSLKSSSSPSISYKFTKQKLLFVGFFILFIFI